MTDRARRPSSRVVRNLLAQVISLAILAVAVPRAARAEPGAPPALRVDLGVASPVGELGAVLSRPVSGWAAVEVGGGYGLSGIQVSAMGKLRLGQGRTVFTPGVGLSIGLPLGGGTFHTGHPNGDPDVPGDPVTMFWLDVDLLGLEHRWASGFTMAASLGLTVVLDHAHYDVWEGGADVGPGDAFPQLRLGVGHAL